MREDTLYDAPKARIEEDLPDHGSILRGFAGGWGALLFGGALAGGWALLVMILVTGNTLPDAGLAMLAWVVGFLPVIWTGGHHYRRGHRDSALGVLLALASLLAPFALFVVYALIVL